MYKNGLNPYNIIPVVYSTDINYAICTSVSITSLLKNASKITLYDIYVLIPHDFPDKYKLIFLNFEKKYRCKISFIEMEDYFNNFPNKIAHTTNQAYYRLVISNLITIYNKVIYLDGDTIIREDLSELYTYDIGDNYYGGVIHPLYYFENWKGHCKLLNIDDLHSYINSGVLVVNINKINEDKLVDVFLDKIKNDYPAIDQDVINSVCYKKIAGLPFKYNVLPKCLEFLKNEKISELYDYESFYRDFKNPSIIHFADRIKPWNNKSMLFADEWWRYYSKSPLRSIINIIKYWRYKIFSKITLKNIKHKELI